MFLQHQSFGTKVDLGMWSSSQRRKKRVEKHVGEHITIVLQASILIQSTIVHQHFSLEDSVSQLSILVFILMRMDLCWTWRKALNPGRSIAKALFLSKLKIDGMGFLEIQQVKEWEKKKANCKMTKKNEPKSQIWNLKNGKLNYTETLKKSCVVVNAISLSLDR